MRYIDTMAWVDEAEDDLGEETQLFRELPQEKAAEEAYFGHASRAGGEKHPTDIVAGKGRRRRIPQQTSSAGGMIHLTRVA
jgi:hypothetical protein